MESIGGFGKDCYALLDRIGTRLAEVLRRPKKGMVARLRNSILFHWQRELGTTLSSHAELYVRGFQ